MTKTLVGLGLDMLTTLVNSQKGSDMRVRVSTYFDTADSKSGNRLALSDPVLIGAITYTFSHCESASVQLRSADCIGVVSWDTTPTKVASYRHSAPL